MGEEPVPSFPIRNYLPALTVSSDSESSAFPSKKARARLQHQGQWQNRLPFLPKMTAQSQRNPENGKRPSESPASLQTGLGGLSTITQESMQ